MPHTSDCVCGASFRFLACDLITGIPKAELHPVSVDWQVTLNQVGTGTLTLAPKDIRPGQLRSRATLVHVTRIAAGAGMEDNPDAASPENPVSEFAGIVENISVESGALQVGLQSIEEYWDHRIVPTATNWNQVSQTVVCDRLAKMTVEDGICLYSAYQTSSIKIDRSYTEWDYKIIGEAIREITELEDGPDYEVVHERVSIDPRGGQGHRWQSTAIFRDAVGADRGIILTGDVEAMDYSITIDGAQVANQVTGLGGGTGIGQLRSVASDTSHPEYPLYQTSQAWTDITLQSALNKQTKGYLEDYAVPIATPGVGVKGLSPDPDVLRVGDTVQVNVGYGILHFKGPARIQSISWNLSAEEPESRTLELIPLGTAADSIYEDPGDLDCGVC